jgi:hypothetical protein
VLDRPDGGPGVRPLNDGVVVADYSWSRVEEPAETEVV